MNTKPSIPLLQSDDAVSLQTRDPRYLDHDAPELRIDDLPELRVGLDDLPPLYQDAVGDSSSSSSAPLLPLNPALQPFDGIVAQFKKEPITGDEYYVDPRLDSDPALLERHIKWWSQTPPRPFVRLLGTHTQSVNDAGKKEKKTVTDFDVSAELTPYLYSDATNQVSWRALRTAEDSENTRRGTVLRKRAPGAKQSIELGLADKPTLTEWCHRYTASQAGLKCLTLERRMVGFDEEKVRQKLISLVRATNYRGSLSVTFPVVDARVTVYNQCKTNVWRLTAWIWWVCVLSLLFIFTWPYLFFRTKRYEVVFAEWPFSVFGENGRRQFVSISEDQWYNLWGRAISRAVLEKRQGILDQQDLIASEGADPVFGNNVVDGAVNLLRAGVHAMNEVNRQLGWGYSS
ncbi:hypothetical protein B0T22DRAFT_461815 [Podospora appendiculata]|uniref:Abc transporter protein n=1 Tax=Podospora appendiculata TaxID=314037 RepID=A0AAE1CDN3_9PEZI|nr:hypothetical protein B0T22DRAFT_461815 [Podospora appendiculata]